MCDIDQFPRRHVCVVGLQRERGAQLLLDYMFDCVTYILYLILQIRIGDPLYFDLGIAVGIELLRLGSREVLRPPRAWDRCVRDFYLKEGRCIFAIAVTSLSGVRVYLQLHIQPVPIIPLLRVGFKHVTTFPLCSATLSTPICATTSITRKSASNQPRFEERI